MVYLLYNYRVSSLVFLEVRSEFLSIAKRKFEKGLAFLALLASNTIYLGDKYILKIIT